MKKENIFQALCLRLFDAYVGDYGDFATHDSKLPAIHDSQSKGDSKLSATMIQNQEGGPSAKRTINKQGKISGTVLAQVA